MTGYYLSCALVFLVAYLINTTMITVFYHRALAHKALELKPWVRKFVIHMGIWLTGLDPKGWVCMHRLHHKHSDQHEDPHSPTHYGFFGVLFAQLVSYERVLAGLARNRNKYTSVVKDIDFDINVLNRKRLWLLPYVLHFGLALGVALTTGFWTLAAGYFFGMMSHPIEGWLVNTLGHSRGYRNYNTNDDSTNNTFAALLIVGEGYQNNHHRYPSSAKFSVQPWEVDLGYAICRTLEFLGCLKIRRELLIPPINSETTQTNETQAASVAIATTETPIEAKLEAPVENTVREPEPALA